MGSIGSVMRLMQVLLFGINNCIPWQNVSEGPMPKPRTGSVLEPVVNRKISSNVLLSLLPAEK
jgi:hypothetical protein